MCCSTGKEPLLGTAESEKACMQDIIHAVEKCGFMEKWRYDKQKRQDVEILEFLVARLSMHTEKIGDANGVHHNLQRLCKVVRELVNIDGLHFNILAAFEAELNTVEGLGPFPSQADLSDFLSQIEAFCDERTTELQGCAGSSLRGYGYVVFNATTNHDQKAAELTNKIGPAARTFALAGLAKVQQSFAQFPVCVWFIRNLEGAIQDTSNFVLFTYGYKVLYPDMVQLCWTQFGDIAKRVIQVRAMSEEEWMRAPFRPIERVQAEVMPKFLFQLIKVKAALNAQVQDVSQARAKILAALAGGALACGNIITAFIFKQAQETFFPS